MNALNYMINREIYNHWYSMWRMYEKRGEEAFFTLPLQHEDALALIEHFRECLYRYEYGSWVYAMLVTLEPRIIRNRFQHYILEIRAGNDHLANYRSLAERKLSP